ncbi:MAG: O-antigen ligase family protein [Planctomycetota bacterium]|jgi:O-antigen ligase
MPKLDSNLNKSNFLVLLEYVLLSLCIAVIIIRTFLTESPNVQAADSPLSLGDNALTLSISALLIFAFICWLVLAIFGSRFSFRVTSIEIPLVIFIIAAITASFAASNRRAAINDTITVIAPIFMAILLVQILNSQSKIKALLYVIASLGVMSSIYCVVQQFWLNDIFLEQYQNDPNSMLEKLSIEAGSFQHMLFEHSLNSKDVRSFFVTGNSAGSFAILTCFAGFALFMQNFKKAKSYLNIKSVIPAVITVINILGLLLTHSKGAIAAFILTAAMIGAYFWFGNWIKRHKKTVLIICLLFVTGGATTIVTYGITSDRVPGGNSMLVRWQYWKASAKMYVNHCLTGVGGGNFGYYYSHYKDPAALETVGDPHNFLLGIITQFGPLGLLAFGAAVFFPLGQIVLAKSTSSKEINTTKAILSLSVLGFLLHNCVDFAIFEPAITTTFWSIIAIIIALQLQEKPEPQFLKKPSPVIKAIVVVITLVTVWSYFSFLAAPVFDAAEKIQSAMTKPLNAHYLLEEAAHLDPLDPTALKLNGQLYLQNFETVPNAGVGMLERAAGCFLGAIERNRADFKNYEKLSIAYNLLGQKQKAYDYAFEAVKRYPGSGRLSVELAKLAEESGKTDIAIKHYKKAIEIEDAYRNQFRIMYPGKEMFSRLGKDKYDFALNQIEKLSSEAHN